MKLNEIAKKTPREQKRLIDVAKAFKKNIKIVLDKKLFFFRGADNHSPISDSEIDLQWQFVQKRTVRRNSVFGNGNWLMSWVDSQWNEFPKRSLSSFATQKRANAEDFGRSDQILMIIPADDVKSFGLIESDFNEASKDAQFLMRAIQKMLATCKQLIGGESTPLLTKLHDQVFKHRSLNLNTDDLLKPSDENVKKYIEALDELLDNIFQIQQRVTEEVKMVKRAPGIPRAESKLVGALKEFRGELKDLGYASVEDYAKTITPKSMKAVHYSDFGQIKSSPSKDDELWFEGNYLGFFWHDEDDMLSGLQSLYNKL